MIISLAFDILIGVCLLLRINICLQRNYIYKNPNYTTYSYLYSHQAFEFIYCRISFLPLLYLHLIFSCYALSSKLIITCFFFWGGAIPAAYGGFEARGPIGAVASGHHSHSNARSEPLLRHHSSQRCQILNPLREARDRTCILMVTS